MNSRTILIPAALAAFSHFGMAGAPGPVTAVPFRPTCVQSSGSACRAPAAVALGAAERTGLERATRDSPRLEALRGGQASDHDLSVALLVVGVILIILII